MGFKHSEEQIKKEIVTLVNCDNACSNDHCNNHECPNVYMLQEMLLEYLRIVKGEIKE